MAGLRVDGTGWVRPIAANTDHGQLYTPHYRLNDGTDPEVLDVIRVDLAEYRPQPGQPENWVIGEQRWALISRPAGPDLYNVLRLALDPGPSLLGSFDKKIRGSIAARAKASLVFIAPSRIQLYLEPFGRRKPQARVIFELSGQQYDLPITDPAWTSRIVRALSRLEGTTHPKEAIGISEASEVLFTVSLGEVYEDTGSCYKLVAGIIVIPEL